MLCMRRSARNARVVVIYPMVLVAVIDHRSSLSLGLMYVTNYGPTRRRPGAVNHNVRMGYYGSTIRACPWALGQKKKLRMKKKTTLLALRPGPSEVTLAACTADKQRRASADHH